LKELLGQKVLAGADAGMSMLDADWTATQRANWSNKSKTRPTNTTRKSNNFSAIKLSGLRGLSKQRRRTRMTSASLAINWPAAPRP